MAQLGIRDFTTQQANIKGENVDILTLQIPKSYTRWEIGQKQPIKLFIPLGQFFTVTSTATTGAYVLTLDYPIALLNEDNPIGLNIYATYGTTTTNMQAATRVTTTPAAAGEYRVTSETYGTIEIYIANGQTLYWNFYFLPNAGRLNMVRKPSVLAVSEIAPSVREFSLASLHRMNQLKSFTALRLGKEATFFAGEYFGFRLLMPNRTATQTTDTNVSKTVRREALFVPFSFDQTPWNNGVGLIELPYEVF
ncbi:MAG: hypothetical protein QXI19_14995 [Candidatus Caldarchaeum sp.]